MNEAQTRLNKIDPKLRDAGWSIVPGSKILVEQSAYIAPGRITTTGHKNPKKADYILEYKGIKLAVIEAKSDEKDVSEGVGQAKEYADAMKNQLPLNPVLNLDVGYVFKMSDIVGDNSQSLAEGMTGNDHIKLVNTLAFPFKSIFDVAVVFGSIARQVKDYNFFNKFSDAYNFTKIVLFTLSISIESSIIKFMQRNNRHTAFLKPNRQKFTDDERIIVHKFYEYVSIEQILLILHHACNLSREGQKYGCRGAFSSYRQRSYRCREVKPETPAAILRHFYAAWHAPALLAQPNALPATDGCLNLARSASEEYFLKTMMYSYATI